MSLFNVSRWIPALFGVVFSFAGCATESKESTSQSIGTTSQALVAITTNASSYSAGAPITVNWADFPGNSLDWIALAPAGSSNTDYAAWYYTGGSTTAGYTFASGLSAGTYVARGFANDSFTLIIESASFTVTSTAALVPNKTSYASGEAVQVAFNGFSTNSRNWIGVAPSGSPATSYTAFQYTDGQTSGSRTFAGLAAGTYIARAYFNDSYSVESTSAEFTISAPAPAVSSNKSSYAKTEQALVSFSGAPGGSTDWIGLAPVGSPATTWVAYSYTGGTSSGTLGFQLANVPEGSYVFRLFPNNTYDTLAESPAFQVVSAGVHPSQSSYASGQPVVLNWNGLPGNTYDWVAIATPGSPNSSYVAWGYTNGLASGSKSFAGLPPGTYVARSFTDNSYDLINESSSFTVASSASVNTDSASYATGQTVTVTFAGLPGNAYDWVAISELGSPDSSFVVYQFNYTGGQQSGSFQFTGLAAGRSRVQRQLVHEARGDLCVHRERAAVATAFIHRATRPQRSRGFRR